MLTGKLIQIFKQPNNFYRATQVNLNLRNALNIQNVRPLYSNTTLGIDNFVQTCQATQKQMGKIVDKFKEKMSDYIQEGTKNMVFTEDLKNMIHVANDEKDLELVVRMIKKFNQQNKELRFGSFIFGTVVMRLFYYHNKPELAIECFKSPELSGFFDQLMTYQILLDMLYENQMYQEMLDCVEFIQQKQLDGIKYPRNIVVLTLAACYKMNSKESLDYALKLWQELKEVGHTPMRRATTFCAALAYNQRQPGIALEILSTAHNQNYTTVRNLKVACLASIGRVENAIPILKSILNEDRPANQKQTFNKDILDKVKEAVTSLDNPEISMEFNKLEKIFERDGHINEASFEQQLCQEIQSPLFTSKNKRNTVPRYIRGPSERDQFVTKKRYNSFQNQRPGLDELV